jgi:ferric-dicitrate binding protein FerR (iron transport regulator)
MSGEDVTGGELDRFQQLVTAALDGQLSDAEKREFDELLAAHPGRRREWEEQKELKAMMKKIQFGQVPEEEWNRYWVNVYLRVERKTAWILISLAAAVLIAFGGYHAVIALLGDTGIPFVVKAAILALCMGGALLLVSVFREKIILSRTDKYKEVQR